MIDDITLSQLITVKISHDISGPAGAVNNGAELYREADKALQADSFTLIEQSAQDLVARLIFFRKTYGTASDDISASVATSKDAMAQFLQQRKIELLWGDQATTALSGQQLQLLFNLTLVMSDMLLFGGTITIAIDQQGDDMTIKLSGESERLNVSADFISLIIDQNQQIEITSKNIGIYYLNRLVQNSCYRLGIEHNNTNIEFSLEKQ